MLFEPAKDPNELTNLVNDPKYAEVAAKLGGLVKQYATGHAPPVKEP